MALDFKEYSKHVDRRLNQIYQEYASDAGRLNRLSESVDTASVALQELAKYKQEKVKKGLGGLASTLGGDYDETDDRYFFLIDQSDIGKGFYTISGRELYALHTKYRDRLDKELLDGFVGTQDTNKYPSGIRTDYFPIISPGSIATDPDDPALPDNIRTEINGEPAMINSIEASFVRVFGKDGEKFLYDNWQNVEIEDPENPGVMIRAYQDAVSSTTEAATSLATEGGIWGTGQGLFGSAGGFLSGGFGTFMAGALPWISAIMAVAGAKKEADANDVKRVQMKEALAQVPGFQRNIQDTSRRINESLERMKDKKSKDLFSIGETVSDKMTEASDYLGSMWKKTRGLHTGDLDTEDYMSDVAAQGEQALHKFNWDWMDMIDKITAARIGNVKQRKELDLKQSEWQAELAYAEDHDETLENIF